MEYLILCTAKTVHLSLYTWTMYKWQEEPPEAYVETVEEKWTLKNLLLFLISFSWDAPNENANWQKDRWGKWKIVRVLNLSRQGQTIARLGAILQRHFFVVLRHGKTRKLMRRKILRIIEWKNRATIQSIHTLRWWPFILKGRTWDNWRITRSMLAESSRTPLFGAHRLTRHFVVSELFSKSCHEVAQSLW